MADQDAEQPAWEQKASDKAQAARMGRAVADRLTEEFGRAATPDPQAAAALRKALPTVAVKFFQAGRMVTPEGLEAEARQGPEHLKTLTDELTAVLARPPPALTYDAVLAELKSKDPFEILLSSPPGEAALVPYEGSTDPKDRNGILAITSSRGSLGWVRWLHEHGADIRANDDCALRWAAHPGHLKIVKYLHEHGADIRADDSDALRRAAAGGHLEVVKYLHKYGANIRADNDGALRKAAQHGHLNIVKYLHEHGADIRADNDYALQWAAAGGHLEVVKYLHEHDANIRADNDGALQFAAQTGHFKIVKYLHEHGADIRAGNDFALLTAAANGHLEVVKYLHKHGANIRANDDTALQWAAHPGHLEVAFYLIQAGASREGLPADCAAKIDAAFENAPAWQKAFHKDPPPGLWDRRPDGLDLKTFDTLSPLLEREGYKNRQANQYAYELATLFGSEERVLRYLRKWGTWGKQPLHDLAVPIHVPQKGTPDLKTWSDAVLKCGPGMAKLVKFAHKLEKPLPTLHETREAIAQFAYERGQEAPAMAAMCFDLEVEEDDFDKALDLYLQQKGKGFPVKNIPDLTIDGATFNMPGAKFHRLAPDDPRGLFLGELTDCCQSIGGVGEACAKHGFTNKDSGFYVVETDKGEIIGQCWAWRGKSGELVLDSLETLGKRVKPEQWQALLKATAENFAKHPQGVTSLRVGAGGGTPVFYDIEPARQPIAPGNYSGYRDSARQYEVWHHDGKEAQAPSKKAHAPKACPAP